MGFPFVSCRPRASSPGPALLVRPYDRRPGSVLGDGEAPTGRSAYAGSGPVEHLGHERGHRAALGPGQRDVAEQRVPLQRLDDRDDAIVAPDAQVVALGDVVGEDDPAALAQAAEGGEEHRALEVLGLVDDHEAVGQAAAPDVGERQHLEQSPVEAPRR